MSPVEKDPAAGLNAALAATFRGERGALGMTFDELSERSGVPVRSLMRFLNAQRHMDMSVLEAIAEALSMTPAEAIGAAQARLAKTQPDYFFVDEKTGRTAVVELKGVGAAGSRTLDLFQAMPRQVQAYVLALVSEAQEPEVAEALNEKLAHEQRIDPQWAREARNFMAHIVPTAHGGTTTTDNLRVAGAAENDARVEPFDLKLTDEDRQFLERTRIGASALPKAARASRSRGRAMRRRQDEDAEGTGIPTSTGSEIIDPR